MTLSIPYMGTKKALAPVIANVISDCADGPVLDLFAGMCSVAEAVPRNRAIWTNDVQKFAATYASARIKSRRMPLSLLDVINALHGGFSENLTSLRNRFREELSMEDNALRAPGASPLTELNLRLFADIFGEAELELAHLRANSIEHPFRLFALTYAGTYFGLGQCIEIDSIIFSISQASSNPAIDYTQACWLLICLGRAMLKCATTTGHFAQFMTPNEANCSRYRLQRRKRIWDEFLDAVKQCEFSENWGNAEQNSVFNSDAVGLLAALMESRRMPAVIYADPPYTDDQYSRYYHLLETVILYDYPATTGKARYRGERFRTPFSLKTDAADAFRTLIRLAHDIKADLVLSYPENGLLHETGVTLLDLLGERYNCVERHPIGHTHSTFGASTGNVTCIAQEVIYKAKIR